MSSCNTHTLLVFILLFPVIILPFVISSPIPNLPYDQFITFLSKNNCSMPKELKLPFAESADPSPFNYLFTPLSECRTLDALKDYGEANMLCSEVFDVLKNITCLKYNVSLSAIQSDHLSENVCQDFQSLKGILPKKDIYLSGRLSDELICKVLCSAEKYEILCKTLFWSYDTLTKINNVLSNEAQLQENGNENMNKVSVSPVKTNLADSKFEPNSQIVKETDKQKVTDSTRLNENKLPISNFNLTDLESQNPKLSNDSEESAVQDIAQRKDSPDFQTQDEANNKTFSTTKNLPTFVQHNKLNSESKIISSEISENNVKTVVESNPQSEGIDNNEHDVDEKLNKNEVKDDNFQGNLDTSSFTNNNINGIKSNQDRKNVTADNLLNNENNKDKINDNVQSKTSVKPVEHIAAVNENDNELKNNNFPEEDDKLKAKTDLDSQEVKEIGNSKQTDYESLNEVIPDNDSKLPEPSTQSILPDEDIEHQEDKDYNDIENENDYNAKSEYDNSLNLPTKNKESEIKSSIVVGSNQLANGYGSNMNPRDNIGQISEEIAMIAPFPDQEDSHFFFYFLTIVLIIMAGYLVFHNKQKIIALIVEGRHERRRRSHGAGYKKLETK